MRRRLRKRASNFELDLTPFMNILVILIPFLLTSAVFSRITILDTKIPAATVSTPSSTEQPAEPPLQLNVILRANSIAVVTNKDGLINRFERTASGYDYKGLSELLQNMKDRIPDHKSINLLLEPDIAYENVVKTMDTLRVVNINQDGVRVQAELFPDISFGDAPATAE